MPPYFEFGVFYAVVRSWACLSVPISNVIRNGVFIYVNHHITVDNSAIPLKQVL